MSCNKCMYIKPGLGPVPKYIHECNRLHELKRVLATFLVGGEEIKIEWVEEYNELLKKMEEIEVLEAHEKKPEASLPGLLLLASAVVGQEEEIAVLDKTVKEQDSLLKHQAVELDDASQDLSALREIYRWRKQSEEHAPANERVLIYDAYRKHFTVDVCTYLDTVNYVFWRPLDLPEEE